MRSLHAILSIVAFGAGLFQFAVDLHGEDPLPNSSAKEQTVASSVANPSVVAVPPPVKGPPGEIPDLQSRLAQVEAVIQSQQAELEELRNGAGPATAQAALSDSPQNLPLTMELPTGQWLGESWSISSQNGGFTTRIGGLVQLDFTGIGHPSKSLSLPDGSETGESVFFRRLRLRAEGTMDENIDFVSEVDFAMALWNTDQLNAAAPVNGLISFPPGVGVQGGNTINVVQPTFVYLTFKEIPIAGAIRIGNQQNWLSLEHITSDWFLDFMERAPIMDAFTGPNNNGFVPGISSFNHAESLLSTWQLGIYKNNLYDGSGTYSIGDAWIYGGRATWTPYYDDSAEGRSLVHLGVGSEYRTFNSNVSATTGYANVRVRSRGDLRIASSILTPNYADTGNFFAASQAVFNPELAIVSGPWLFQAEYSGSWFNGASAAQNVPNSSLGAVYLQGGYAEALVFLTGEQKKYDRRIGAFTRVEPRYRFSLAEGTWGAWQVGLRFDWLDLNSGANGVVNGGNSQDATVGLNWFLNAHARIQLNYVHSWVNNAPVATYPGTIGNLNGVRYTGVGGVDSVGARLDFNF